MKREFIFNKLRESGGSHESTEVMLVTTIRTGETEVVVKHEVIERFPVQELEKAEDLFERLTCGAGRRVYKPSDLAHHHNPN